MTEIQIPRPTSGDVVELILSDHRLFEDLLRECRRPEADRDAARAALAELLVAHATAEEEKVYTGLRRAQAISGHEEEHSEEEHAEIIEALLAFLKAKGADTEEYDAALEDLATVVNHHSNEEEQSILTPAREDVGEERRADLGAAWASRRNQLLEAGCASQDQVAALLAKDVAHGTIAPADVREEAEAIKAAAKEKAEALEDAAKEESSG